MRLIDDLEFRNRIVDYFEDVRSRFEIVNKNNAVFVDELYDGTIMRQGLITPKCLRVLFSSDADETARGEAGGALQNEVPFSAREAMTTQPGRDYDG